MDFNLTIKPDCEERAVLECLSALSASPKRTSWGRTELNQNLSESLAVLGIDRGYGVYPSSQPEHQSAWLYDLIWIEQSQGLEGYLQGVPLAVESELGSPNEVSDDFQKLLVACADHRLLVFSADTSKELGQVLAAQVDQIKQSKLPQHGDRFLFAGWLWGPEAKFDVFFIHVVGVSA